MFPQEDPPARKYPKPKRHNAKYCSLAIRERIVNALAAGDPKSQIARALRVSPSTVYAVGEQEWSKVESRKARIAAQAERAATRSYERINQRLDSEDDIPLNQLTIIAGVSVDKLLALRGDPGVVARLDIEHTHRFNIFELFNRYHQDALKILKAKTEQASTGQLALPDAEAGSQGWNPFASGKEKS